MRTKPKWRIIAGGVTVLAVVGSVHPGRPATPLSPAPTGVSESPLTLTYVANMGVLLSCGETKVLIDALFDQPNPEYRAPAPETLDKIVAGQPPFDGVDLVLVTHDHPDHFAAGLAVRYLEARSEPVLVAPTDAVEAMRAVAQSWANIGPRIVPIGLEVGQKRALDVKGIPFTACRTLHSGDRDAPMNLMYVLEVEGRRVWHEGDPNGRCDAFQAFGLKDIRFDLAVAHYWYPLEPNCARFLQEDIEVRHIALAHLPIRLEGDAPGKIDLVRQNDKDLFLLLPGMPDKVLPSGGPAAAPTLPGIGVDHPVLFYSGRNDNKDVYVLRPGEKEPRNLTRHPAQDLCPAASPDGTRVLFLSDRGGQMDIYGMAPDGRGARSLPAPDSGRARSSKER